ncbi:MAG: excinuclease ABC subunit UvrA [Bacteroidota bacterium]
MSEEKISIYGARVHNLKNIDISIPRNKFVVFTGISGSGKSSLAFDTIFAEGQRRYMDTFSSYARQFIGTIERPDVDKIDGLSPVIAIEQKTVNKNPRSTVGTITEIYDFIRLLYSKTSEAYSINTGEKMVKYSEKKIVELICSQFENKKIILLSPVIKGRKGHYKELFDKFRKFGFIYARINDQITELKFNLKLDRYKTHNIEIVIDKLLVDQKDLTRITNSVQLSLKHGNGICAILDNDNGDIKYFSKHLMCPTSGISYNDPAPHTFSFNSPHGACQKCNGMGYISEVDIAKIIPDNKISISAGGILPIGKFKTSPIFWQLEALGEKFGFALSTPIKDISDEGLRAILYGSGEPIRLKTTPLGYSSNFLVNFYGITNTILENQEDDKPRNKQKWADRFISKTICDECNGTRLKKESLYFKITDMNIADLASMDIDELYNWFVHLDHKLTAKQLLISSEITKEIKNRLKFILDVGLNYISLNRSSQSLSGGESQRIRLATQIGSQLVNVLYILDEPSIGLHHKDNSRLIESLKKLRDSENSIIVVEHDREMIESSDYIVDFGPGAGRNGGKIVANGSLKEILMTNTLTAEYLKRHSNIDIPEIRRQGNGKVLKLIGAKGHNLKNIDLSIPLGVLVCITGVSGSGKSSIINDTLYPILNRHFFNSLKEPLPYSEITGIENIDKVIEVSQSPIGKTPRSNPATYTGMFSEIRKIFEILPESKVRGYKAGRFSFNIKGGRCETCKGSGLKTIEMNFLPDVYVKCEDCNGQRYNYETLQVRFKGKSINDVLEMTINQSFDFFSGIPSIQNKCKILKEIGLGYLKLGQPSTTLSGGEAQRIKLASELSKKDTGKTLFMLDEPTTGLHFEDVKIFLKLITKLIDRGNTVIVIEHNLDVIKVADYIIDLGLEGGKNGGYIICEGSPEKIIKNKESYTAKSLLKELNYNFSIKSNV